MGSIRTSLFQVFAGNQMAMVLQFVSTLVLSRLLTPEQIGVFSVAAVLAALASVIRDFGVGEYLIQEANLTADKLRAAFTLNIAVSWGMGLLLVAARGPVAQFYRDTGVADVMTVLACNFFLIPFGAVTMAWFRRQMNFTPHLWASLLSALVSTTLSITLALNGFGYMSMAWAALAGTACTVLIANLARPRELPLLPGIREIGSVFSFGFFASGIYVIAQAGKGAPDLVIGRAAGLEAAGLFSRAAALIEAFHRGILNGIMSVALPYFAAERRAGRDVKPAYLRGVSYLTAIGWPFLGVLALLAYSVVNLLYGDQWDSAVTPLQLLCAAFALQLAYHMTQEVLIAAGHVRRATRLRAQMEGTKIALMLLAAPFGLVAICASLIPAAALAAGLAHRDLASAIGLSLADVGKACAKSLALTTATLVPAALVVAFGGIGRENYVAPLALAVAASGIAWLAAVVLLRHPLAGELRLLLQKFRRVR